MHNTRSMTAPFMGTENQNTPKIVTSAISKYPIMAAGIVFPNISSNGLMGVTISCSIVPTSRSLTIDMDVNSRQVSITINAITPGTI